MTRQGASEVSLRAIAREAGVTAAAPYHHFDDRESLLAEVAAAGFLALEATMRGAATEAERRDASPLDRLQATGIAYVEFAAANPEIYRLMFSGLLSDRGRFPGLREAADSAFAVLQRLVGGPSPRADGVKGESDLELAAWSTVHGLAFLAIEDLLDPQLKAEGVAEAARRVTTVLGRGLKAYTSAGPEPDVTM